MHFGLPTLVCRIPGRNHSPDLLCLDCLRAVGLVDGEPPDPTAVGSAATLLDGRGERAGVGESLRSAQKKLIEFRGTFSAEEVLEAELCLQGGFLRLGWSPI